MSGRGRRRNEFRGVTFIMRDIVVCRCIVLATRVRVFTLLLFHARRMWPVVLNLRLRLELSCMFGVCVLLFIPLG